METPRDQIDRLLLDPRTADPAKWRLEVLRAQLTVLEAEIARAIDWAARNQIPEHLTNEALEKLLSRSA